jgi:teichuronic acid biosynthesis glycosyltransferase TuaG
MTDLVSIVMPAYNAKEYIGSAIDSVLDQTYPFWELVIVDDGSTDQTFEYVHSNYNDPRIILIRQQNKRLGGARNRAMESCSGKWIAFLDSDDLWERSKLGKQMTFLKQHQNVDVIFSTGYIFTGNDTNNLLDYETVNGFFDPATMYRMEYEGNYIPVLSVVARKTLIDRIGRQEENRFFAGCEDWDYWIRMAKAGAVFYGHPEKLFYYRKHAASMSNDNVMMRLSQASLFLKNYDPTLINKQEAFSRISPLIYPLVFSLIDKKDFAAVRYLLSNMLRAFPSWHLRATLMVASAFRANSKPAVALISKIRTAISMIQLRGKATVPIV